MNQSATAILNFQEFIDVDGDRQTTDSIKVARVHGKRHYNVLRSIQGLFEQEESREFAALNFEGSYYYDSNGRKSPMYVMTKNGYTMLAMGFNGKKAMKFKVAYIGAFNAMAAFIQNKREGLDMRCFKKELEVKASETLGSFHGRGLNKRKQEKPGLEAELAVLQALKQPSLLN